MKIYHIKTTRTGIFKALLSVNVGWSHEPPGMEGLSHFLEHAIFLGNEMHPEPDNESGRFGVMLNGETLPDRTIFFFNSLSENAEEILDLLLSIVFKPSFPEDKVREEKKSKIMPAIVKESDFTPWELAYQWAKNLIFQWDFRKSMGTLESLEGLGIEELKEWHAKYYSSSNAVLLISSPLDVEIDIPRGGEIPVRRSINYLDREIVLERGIENAEVVFAFPFEVYDLRAFLLSFILGSYPTSKFWHAFHRDAYMVESRCEWYGSGGFFLYIGANDRDYGRIVEKFAKFLENLRISPEDLETAKKIAKLEILERAGSVNSLMHLLGVDPQLNFGGFEGILERLEDLEIQDLRDYASTLLDMKNLRSVVVR